MANRKLAVLEAEWFTNHREASVYPALQMLTRLKEIENKNVYYERFVGESSFRESVQYFAENIGVRWYYIATHGDNDSGNHQGYLLCPNGDKLSRSKIRTMFKDHGSKIEGVLLGSCLIGGTKNLDFFLTPSEVGLEWVAGYETSVDWIDSTVLDMMFWRIFIQGGGSVSTRVARTWRRLNYICKGLVDELKFNIHYVVDNEIYSARQHVRL